MNPPKFDMCEDMSGLTYLNDASVLWNLTARYVERLIYVSLLKCNFCAEIMPTYRKLYTALDFMGLCSADLHILDIS